MRRRTPLAGFLVADAISLTGTRISMLAIPWLVLTTTGSASKTGLAAFAEMLPLVLAKAFAGPLMDRIGTRRVAIACDILSAVVVGLVPVLHVLGLLHFGALLGLVALAGAARGPGDGAKHAFVPTLADAASTPLERVTGLSGAIERTASFAGAAMAGGLIAWAGPANALAVDAASFGLGALVFGLATARMRPPAPDASASGYLRRLREGWDFLRCDAVLVGITSMVAVTNLLDQASTAVLMPVWGRASGHGIGVLGAYFAAWSAASAGGALVAAWLGPRLPRFHTYVVAFLIAGAPRFLLFALGAPLGVIFAMSVAGGFASGFLNPILGAVIYERIPAPLMGRVSSLNTALCWSLIPLGGLLGGGLVTGVGLAAAFAVVGAGYFGATMLPALRRSFRDFDTPTLLAPRAS